ncbi:MAG: 5-(carboxyamino)imidazole ribonucleotide mutase [Candidatus Syntrophoarchaeum sp.]|nr:5-(carboxyamino)imidazole ribonucleotide mutase [Candidatus Syntrophoarchaeum sp.]
MRDKVAILIGSESDMSIAIDVCKVLDENGVKFDLQTISAHRNPEELDMYLKELEQDKNEIGIIIAIAGLAAALPGVIASKTGLPVIGVPVSAKLMGLDALLSMVQMPKGVPVAVVGIDNGKNAAHLAVRILRLVNEKR